MNDDDFYEFETDIIQCCWRIDNLTILRILFMTMTLSEEEDEWHCMISLEVKVSEQTKVRIFDNYAFYIQHYLFAFMCINSPVLFYLLVSFFIQTFVYIVFESDSCHQNFAKADGCFQICC